MKDEPVHPNAAAAETIFNAALAFSAVERPAYLAGACGDNHVLRQRVEALLRAHEEAPRFMPDAPPPPIATIKLNLPAAADEAVGQTLGRYKLLEKIGEGGCGVVYVAEQTQPVRRRVALKVIKLGMDTKDVVARFEAERQALAMMDHPNIAKVFDAGTTETGRPYFVMELVRGIRMTDYCDQANLSTKERLDLFIKVCQAIQHAHQKGIIHRDIKPSNILVTLHDGVPVPKVIDFGIAKATEGRLTDATVYTQLHQFMGTPAYMSPEQAEMSGLDIDTRSDIYSLGVLLYELLAGSTPFDAQELMASGLDAMRKTIREKEPVRPSTRLATLQGEELTTAARHRSADVPKLIHLLKGDLDWIVMKCLEKDRTHRYETASGLASDLKRHLDNEPVLARPPSSVYRLQRMVRRNKLVFAAASAVVLALLAGLGLSTWSFLRERKAHANARHLLYAADLNLAQEASDQNNMVRLGELLEETQEFPDRDFEWFYWQRQTHLSLKTFRGDQQGSLSSVAFSPDGQRIVTGGMGNTAKVWDVASGRVLLTLEGHKKYIPSVAFSPDGRRIVTGSQDQTARVWDAASGKELLILKGHTNEIHSVAFSQDGRMIVTGSQDGTTKVWETASGRELLTLSAGGYYAAVAFSPDSRRIVTGGFTVVFDATAKVWDVASGQKLLTLKGHNANVISVAFSPDGQRIVTGSQDNTAKVWDAVSGRELLTLQGHTGAIQSVAFSPDSRRIVTGSADRTAKVWEAASGRALLTFKEHHNQISSVTFSSDGRRIVTASYDCTAKLWEADMNPSPLTLKGHGAAINSVAFSPDSQRIVTGSADHTAKLWEAASGRELLTLKGQTEVIESVAFSPDGQRIVTGAGDNTAKVWEAASGRELLTLKGHTNIISSVAFSPDGRKIVTGSEDNTAKVWDAASGLELLTFKGHTGKIAAVSFSPDGRSIVTGSWDWMAKVWDATTGRELLTLNDLRTSFWQRDHTPIISVAFSPDGRRIATASWDNTAKIWDLASGRVLLTLKGHNEAVSSVAFSPDGRRIVTGSNDQTAKLWDAASGRELLTFKGHNGMVTSVAFSPDGQRIVIGSWDQTATVWEAARKEQVAQWQAEEAAPAQH